MKLPKLRPILRVQAYLTTVAVVLLGAKLGMAYRTTEQTFRDVGGKIAQYLSARADGAESVSLNGETFAFATMTSEESVEQVLSATEQACVANSGNIGRELSPIIEQARQADARLGLIDAEKLTTLRRDSQTGKESGDVTCLTRTPGPHENPVGTAFLERLERFVDNFELGELGEAHYLHAGREPGSDKTTIIYVRSLGRLKLSNLFPEGGGDAPGRDPRDVPRPPGSVRTLSANIDRTSDGFFSYESPDSAPTVLAFYDRQLGASWEKIRLNEEDADTLRSRAYARDGR
ncbi:MAG TPA: hypothetical protein VER04_23965, partial [Polyangiaceae bacterium]|nr:hypothetical protein [Polyangiaceae bacterium]